MGMQGNLDMMNLPTLVQFAVQDGGMLHLRMEQPGTVGSLYFEDNQLQYAELTHTSPSGANNTYGGEEVVYELLSWREAQFLVEKNIPPPSQNIEQSWDFLLMEGLRRVDEQAAVISDEEDEEAGLTDMLLELSEEDATALQELLARQMENDEMATKREQLQTILNDLVHSSGDISGAVIVDNDGLLLAGALSGNTDGNRVAAITAGLISLAGRTAQQLGQGDVKQTLIQAEIGNIVAIRASAKGSFVALTPANASLGMIFMECREAADAIADVLG